MLETESLNQKSFLDIGCGSGLFSLAAMRMGAARVHSFDFDRYSVACAHQLRRQFDFDSNNWTVEQASVLDSAYLEKLGQFDVVYSWGVLHHTGNMWQALENVATLVLPQGKLFISIYNDQGRISRFWRTVKRLYSKGLGFRLPIIAIFGSFLILRGFLKDIVVLQKNPMTRYREYKRLRGMSYFTDLLDWLGGYPFEVAKPEDIFDLYRRLGFELLMLRTIGGDSGTNQFVFRKRSSPPTGVNPQEI